MATKPWISSSDAITAIDETTTEHQYNAATDKQNSKSSNTNGSAVGVVHSHQDPVFQRVAVYFGELSPTGFMSCEYMTEGAANVVWKVCLRDSNLARYDSSIVLRMRKDIASTIPMLEAKRQFEDRIAPLFECNASLLLPVHLVEISPRMVAGLNRQLRHLEDTRYRHTMRAGIFLPDFDVEPYAIVMPNLSHGAGKFLEFKPKWLVQSPSAPRNAQRCRTCALNAMRRAKGNSGRGDSGLCPFDLLSRNRRILCNALRQIWHDEDTLLQFVTVFETKVQPALRHLQKLQRQHNEVGLGDFSNFDKKDFSVAMALRDCSMVLKVVNSHREGELDVPTVKLLDLDLKHAGGGKLAKWASMEAELIEDGWYTSTEDSSIPCAMTFQ